MKIVVTGSKVRAGVWFLWPDELECDVGVDVARWPAEPANGGAHYGFVLGGAMAKRIKNGRVARVSSASKSARRKS